MNSPIAVLRRSWLGAGAAALMLPAARVGARGSAPRSRCQGKLQLYSLAVPTEKEGAHHDRRS